MDNSMQHMAAAAEGANGDALVWAVRRGAELVVDQWLTAWRRPGPAARRPDGHRVWCTPWDHCSDFEDTEYCVSPCLYTSDDGLGVWLIESGATSRLAVDNSAGELALGDARSHLIAVLTMLACAATTGDRAA